MKTRYVVTLICLMSIALASPTAASDGWKLSKLNPFKKAEKPRARASVSDKSAKGFLPKISMPKISMPKWGSKKTTRSNQPSTFTKLNQGTRRFFGKTKSVLMPWQKPPKKEPLLGSRPKKPVEKKSIFPSWLGSNKKSEPEKTEIQTPSDFLGLKRPGF